MDVVTLPLAQYSPLKYARTCRALLAILIYT